MAFEKETNPFGAKATYVSSNRSNFKKGFSKKTIWSISFNFKFPYFKTNSIA